MKRKNEKEFRTSNIRKALEIVRLTGGTLRELIPEKIIPLIYNTAAKEVRNEISRGFCPKLISGYKLIDYYQNMSL